MTHIAALPGNPYDGHTLATVIWQPSFPHYGGHHRQHHRAPTRRCRLSRPQCAYKFRITSGQKRRLTPQIKRELRSNQPDTQRRPNFLTMFVGGPFLNHEQDPTCRCSNLELYYFRVVTLTTRRNVEPRFLRIVGAPSSVVLFLDVTIPVLAPVTRRGFLYYQIDGGRWNF